MADLGTTNEPGASDNLQLPSTPSTTAPTSAGDGIYTFFQLLQRFVGFLRWLRNDYVVVHKPNADAHHAKSHAHNGADGSGTVAHSATTGITPNDHHNRQHDLASASDHTVTADLPMGGHKITGMADGSNAADAATWGQVQNLLNGLDWHQSVRAATTGALAAYTRVTNVITANANGALAAVDGVTLVVNDRLLLKNGAAGADNGLYTVTQVGDGSHPFILTRATDADTSAEVTSALTVVVTEGTTLGGSAWMLSTADPITLNTTALTFTQVAGPGTYSAGTGLTLTGTTFALGYDATAPTTSALGDAASAGASAAPAHRDHVHGRESFGAVTPQTAYGSASANGSAATPAHSDHTHGTVGHDAHANLTGIGTDDHHAKLHASDHGPSGADPILDTIGMGLAFTIDPMLANQLVNAGASNRCTYIRIKGGCSSITKLDITVGASSGNIGGAVYNTSGTGRSAVPNSRTQTTGSIACPAIGDAQISLGGAIAAPSGITWFALAADNTTATFYAASSGFVGVMTSFVVIQDTAMPPPSPAASLSTSSQRGFVIVGVP